MTSAGENRAVVRAARFAVVHAPDLVVSGSKPRRELHTGSVTREQLTASLRTFPDAAAYPPHQVLIGNLTPAELAKTERPWHQRLLDNPPLRGPGGCLLDQIELYASMARGDSARLLRFARSLPTALEEALDNAEVQRLDETGLEQAIADGAEPMFHQGQRIGVLLPAHEADESLAAPVLLENLTTKVSGVLALADLLRDHSEPIDHLLGCGEEAVGDRYQRGGGNLAKAIGEQAGAVGAAGTDAKSFCAGPLHAMLLGAALIQSGMARRVVVVGGGSLAKLGMKFRGHLDAGYPILEDVLVGVAIDMVANDGTSPVIECPTWHRIGDGSAAHQLTEALSQRPLAERGLRLSDVDRYAVELHNPDITEPAGSGDVPTRNYQILAAMAVKGGEIERADMPGFVATRGMPGFCPTQGHIASAIPYLPHAITALVRGEAERVQLVAKGSLFLGRMTGMSDGASFLLERNPALEAP